MENLRDSLGQWWKENLNTPVFGTADLAFKFTKPHRTAGWSKNKKIFLSPKIKYGCRVTDVTAVNEGVIVKGHNTTTGNGFEVKGDAVIVTLPIPILRQTEVTHSYKTEELNNIKRVLGNFHYEPSTKVLLQCRERFWEDDVGNGGFSKTDQPIGQVHYPTDEDRIPYGDDSPHTHRAILVCYNWGQEASMMASQTEQEAVASAVRQVKNIHPNIDEYFEVRRQNVWILDIKTII